jgi:hypothetical protein
LIDTPWVLCRKTKKVHLCPPLTTAAAHVAAISTVWEKWGVDVQDLKKPSGPRRLFKCLVEDWENVMDQGQVMRVKLLNKYGGLVFDDIDNTPLVHMRVFTT